MVKIKLTFGLAEMRLSDFHQKIGNHISRDSKRGDKFGEDRWRIVICRAFNSFHVTDSLTD